VPNAIYNTHGWLKYTANQYSDKQERVGWMTFTAFALPS